MHELDDLEALLGRRPESVGAGRAAVADAVAAGAVSDERLPAPPVAPGGPGDRAGPACHGRAGRPTLARADDERAVRCRPRPTARRAYLPDVRPRRRRLPRRGDDRSVVGDRDQLVLLERSRAQSRRVDLLPGPSQREPLQRRSVGVGRQRGLPVGAALPSRVFGPAAAATFGARHARLRVAQRCARAGAGAPSALRRLATRIRAGSNWTSSSRRSWRPTRTRRAWSRS